METILFDTDYLIDYLRGNSMVREILVSTMSENKAFISVLSIYEIYAGIRPGEEKNTEHFIQAFRIEPVTPEIAQRAGAFRSRYKQRGITLSIVECIISETARTNNHLVATMNKKDYQEIKFLS